MKDHDPNQGEGDRTGARHYNRRVREFIAEGRVDDAARDARDYLETEPEAAERAERRAKRGPKHGTRVSVDELVAKSRTVIGRVRPYVKRAAARVLARFTK
jgi:hypothetical protein